MSYTTEQLEEMMKNRASELMVVLDSDREYELHLHDTDFDHDAGRVESRGMIDDDYFHVQFPAETVEHVRWHEEL